MAALSPVSTSRSSTEEVTPRTGRRPLRVLPARCGGAAGVVNQAVANQKTATSQHQGRTPPQAALQAPAPATLPTQAPQRQDTASQTLQNPSSRFFLQ